MELAAARFTQEQATVALAVVDSMRARLADDAGDRASAAEHWRAALVVDPGCLPAARAIRRDVARRGDLALALDATEAEAACLRVPEHRVHALLLAAALAEDAARGLQMRRRRPARVSIYRRRAIALLRAVLEIDPAHEGAFEQLRTLLGDDRGRGRRWRPRWRRASRWRRIRSRSRRCGSRAPSCWRERWAIARARAPSWTRSCTSNPSTRARWPGCRSCSGTSEAWGEAGEVYLRRTVRRARARGVAGDLPAPRPHLPASASPTHAARSPRTSAFAGSNPTTARRCRRCPSCTWRRVTRSRRCP